MSEIYVGARMQDGHVVHVALQTTIRIAGGVLHMAWTDAEIQRELARYYPLLAKDGRVMLDWRKLSAEEHALFSEREVGQRRWYRNALTDVNGVLRHDMTKAKEMHRDRLRHSRSRALARLDGEWMRASGRGETILAASIDQVRQRLRDWPKDPRIEHCQSIVELRAHLTAIQEA